MTRRLGLAGLALALMAGTALAQQQGVTDTEILVGNAIPLTGPPALLGVAHSSGVKAAFAEVNAKGGIAGRKLRYIVEDDGYVTARTLQSMRKLIDVDKVFAIVGGSGAGQTIASLPIFDKAGIPVIASNGPVRALWEPTHKGVFSLGQAYETGITELVRYLAEKNPGKKWALVTQDDDYGIAMRDGFDVIRKEKKLNVVYEANYKRGQQDFSSEMVRMKDSGAEVLLAGGVIGENVAMVKEMEKLGVKPAVGIFWPGRVEAILKVMGPGSDGIFAVDYVEPFAGPAGQAFMEKIKPLLSEAEFKGVNRYTMVGYAGGRLLVSALERCAQTLTWACTIAELEKTKNLDTGVMAPISFGPGVRFSNAQVQIMQADFGTLSYKAAPK